MVPSFHMTSFGGRRVCSIRFISSAFSSGVNRRVRCSPVEEGYVLSISLLRYDLLRYHSSGTWILRPSVKEGTFGMDRLRASFKSFGHADDGFHPLEEKSKMVANLEATPKILAAFFPAHFPGRHVAREIFFFKSLQCLSVMISVN
nr:hypothetical protein [Tanacetum cinerariifolium]